MESHDPLMLGMFWGGLILASVPLTLSIGIGVYVLRRYLRSRQEPHAESGAGSADRVEGKSPAI